MSQIARSVTSRTPRVWRATYPPKNVPLGTRQGSVGWMAVTGERPGPGLWREDSNPRRRLLGPDAPAREPPSESQVSNGDERVQQ
jgi:hypothetical protein